MKTKKKNAVSKNKAHLYIKKKEYRLKDLFLDVSQSKCSICV